MPVATRPIQFEFEFHTEYLLMAVLDWNAKITRTDTERFSTDEYRNDKFETNIMSYLHYYVLPRFR